MCVSLIAWGVDESNVFWADSVNVVGGAPASNVYGDGGGPLMPVACSGIRGASWEVWEAKNPMVVEHADYATDSSGAGRYRGGPGVDFMVTGLVDMDLTIVNERSQVAAVRARRRSRRGRRNEAIVHYPDGTSEEFAKVTGVHLPKGSRIEVRSGGGAGWGPLEDRTAGEVHADVNAGLLREETARRLYPHAYSG